MTPEEFDSKREELVRVFPSLGKVKRIQISTMSEEERLAQVADREESVRILDSMTDETETGEIWDDVSRNLGVDPRTGRGLES